MFLVPLTRNASHWVRNFDRLFDEPVERWFAPAAAEVARGPALDIAESDRAYTVTLDLPGVGKDDVKVAIDGRRVSVEARAAKNEAQKAGDRVIYRERTESSYARNFALPADVDQERSSAKLDNGVLKLELVKRRPAGAAKIAIN